MVKRESYMKKKFVIITLFPTIYVVVLSFLTVIATSPLNSDGAFDFVKGLMVISLVVLFPLLIVMQSIISAINHFKGWLPVGVSVVATMFYLLVLMRDDTRGLFLTMVGYAVIYSIEGFIGYGVGKVICKLRSTQKVK